MCQGGEQNEQNAQEDVDLVERDMILNVHDVDSELRRVSDFGPYGMEAGFDDCGKGWSVCEVILY